MVFDCDCQKDWGEGEGDSQLELGGAVADHQQTASGATTLPTETSEEGSRVLAA